MSLSAWWGSPETQAKLACHVCHLPAGRGSAGSALGSLSLQLTERKCAAPSDCQHWAILAAPLSPTPREGCDAQVMAGDKQRVAIHVTGAQAAPGLGIPCFLYSGSVRKNSLLTLAYSFGGTRPPLALVQRSASLSPQHPEAAQQALHHCWERGERNQCRDPEWYLPREGTSDV